MEVRDLLTGAYLRFHELIAENRGPTIVPLLGYEYPRGQPDLVYEWEERDFTCEIVNAFNEFAVQLQRLSLWERVLSEYEEEQILELRLEFTTVPMKYCLSVPYKFRQRITFSATQLCYTKGLQTRILTKGDLKPDDDINLMALSAVAKHWKGVSKLVEALKRVHSEEHRHATDNYRHKAQHRHPRNIDFGHTANVVRAHPEGYLVSFSLGDASPISTSKLLPVLVTEAEQMRAAFGGYRELVDEHTGASGSG